MNPPGTRPARFPSKQTSPHAGCNGNPEAPGRPRQGHAKAKEETRRDCRRLLPRCNRKLQGYGKALPRHSQSLQPYSKISQVYSKALPECSKILQALRNIAEAWQSVTAQPPYPCTRRSVLPHKTLKPAYARHLLNSVAAGCHAATLHFLDKINKDSFLSLLKT